MKIRKKNSELAGAMRLEEAVLHTEAALPPSPRPRLRKPALALLAYQRRWVEDDAPLKLVVKARQTGYSFAATLRAVLQCLERKLTWIFLSKGERQSRLLMEKVREHIQACGIVARTTESAFFEGTLTRQLEARFPNGSVIYGLPANPDTARGYTGNVTLDEFAFHQDAAKVYSALYPAITRGYGLEIISTPNGQQGKFYELAKAAGLVEQFKVQSPESRRAEPRTHNSELRTGWSGHRTSIYEAVAQGLEVDIDRLRSGVDDEETWLQEYCCEFLSDAQNYIPMEMIMSCVSEEASTDWAIGPSAHLAIERSGDLAIEEQSLNHSMAKSINSGELYLGVDIGRKRDLSVAWLFEKIGDVMWSRALLAMKGQTFEVQEKAISDLIEGAFVICNSELRNYELPSLSKSEATVRRCCVDQSGLGMMLAERLQKRYGARVEPVQFTAPVKEKLAPLVKRHFEDRLVRIPDDREVRADLNAVKRYVTPAGNVRFDAERTERGHADRFWALALALNAAAQPTARFAEHAAAVGRPIAPGFGARAL